MTTASLGVAIACVTTAYVATVVAANVATSLWPEVLFLALTVPAGTMLAGLTFTLRDLLHEAVSPRALLGAVAVGTGVSWLLASPQIAAASACSFAASELIDSIVYGAVRRRSRVLAIVVSNVVGLVVDSLLFVPLAFGSFTAVPGQVVGKAAATLLVIAPLLVVRRVRR